MGWEEVWLRRKPVDLFNNIHFLGDSRMIICEVQWMRARKQFSSEFKDYTMFSWMLSVAACTPLAMVVVNSKSV